MRESVLKCTHSIFFFKQLPLLIYLWLHWIFIAAQAFLWLRRAGATLHCSTRDSHYSGFF